MPALVRTGAHHGTGRIRADTYFSIVHRTEETVPRYPTHIQHHTQALPRMPFISILHALVQLTPAAGPSVASGILLHYNSTRRRRVKQLSPLSRSLDSRSFRLPQQRRLHHLTKVWVSRDRQVTMLTAVSPSSLDFIIARGVLGNSAELMHVFIPSD